MQCKDIPDAPILQFLARRPGEWHNWIFNDEKDVRKNAMPPGVPWPLALAKMRGLIRKKLVDGCPCGCRGDFVITAKGLESLRGS